MSLFYRGPQLLILLLIFVLFAGCVPANKEAQIKKNHPAMIAELMKQRYTVRSFNPNIPVKKEDLQLILQAGRRSPSKNNLYPYKIIVLTDSPRSKEIRGQLWTKHAICNHCLPDGTKVDQRIQSIASAPITILFMTYPKPEKVQLDKDGQAMASSMNSINMRVVRDVTIPATVMMLQAEQLGYGTAFTGIARGREKLAQSVGLPAGYRHVLALSIGTPLPIEATQNAKPIALDIDCLGKMDSSGLFTVVERDKKGNVLAVSKTVDRGPTSWREKLDHITIL